MRRLAVDVNKGRWLWWKDGKGNKDAMRQYGERSGRGMWLRWKDGKGKDDVVRDTGERS